MAEEKIDFSQDEKPVFTWKAPEFVTYQKGAVWFVIVALVAIVLIGIFVWMKNWTAAGVILAAAFAIFSMSRANPKKITCSLYHGGVVIEEKAYRFKDLKSFWIVFSDNPSAKFTRPGRFSIHINMPIADEDPEQIRLFLAKYLPEESDRGEDISDTLSKWLKI